jgi:hypothetical protein
MQREEYELRSSVMVAIEESESSGQPKQNSTDDEYRQWKLAKFGSEYMIWHEGLELTGMRSLTGNRREY